MLYTSIPTLAFWIIYHLFGLCVRGTWPVPLDFPFDFLPFFFFVPCIHIL